jgi:hypothetical protein
MRLSYVPTALLTAAVLIAQQTATFIPTPRTPLPLCYVEFFSRYKACTVSQYVQPELCFDLEMYKPVSGCAEQGSESVNAQITGTEVVKGGAESEVPQIKAMAGGRDAVVTATRCCVFTEVQSRAKHTITECL